MSVSTNDVLRVAARLNVPATGDFVNVYYYRYNDVAARDDSDVLDDLAAEMDTLYTTINGSMSDQANYIDVNVFNMTDVRPLGSVEWPVLSAGTQGGDMLPAQVAAFVRATTGYSRNWAKKYIGPFVEGCNALSGTWNSGTLSQLANYGAEWLLPTGFSVGMYTPVVWHKRNGVWRQLSEVILSNVPATVRRRRAGRGS